MATKKTTIKPVVIRDTREKKGQGWFFGGDASYWGGTTISTLRTGDYSVEGLERFVCIERKKSVNEFMGNLFMTWQRFQKELHRMRKFGMAAIVLEFTADDVLDWKKDPKVADELKKKLDTYALISRITEIQIEYPNIHVVYAGNRGREFAGYLLKKAYQQYGSS
jgi:ERCC4-type nuclease